MINIFQWTLILCGISLGSAGGILLKLGARDISHDEQITYILWSVITNYKILLGLALYVVPTFIWIYLLKDMELSLLQPIFSLVYVITPLMAVLLLNEHVSLQRCLGITAILIGVFVISRG